MKNSVVVDNDEPQNKGHEKTFPFYDIETVQFLTARVTLCSWFIP